MTIQTCRWQSVSLVNGGAFETAVGPARAVALLWMSLLAACGGGGSAPSKPFIESLDMVGAVASTIPENGDVNPYGTAVVPQSMGELIQGSILVSNFNDSANQQGTGTTIVQIAPDGSASLFAQIDASMLRGQCEGGVGLTAALVALNSGWVIVGSLPTIDGTSATAHAGCLIVLNTMGQVAETLSGTPISGPWGMNATETNGVATLYVTNVLDGTVAASPNVVSNGTVVRISLSDPIDNGSNAPPSEMARTVIGSGFGQRTDPAALVIGVTGVGLARNGTLYIADTLANRIAAIPNASFRLDNAGTGQTVSNGGALDGPLGLTIAPNGNILTVNSGDGNIVETTPAGTQVAVKLLDNTGNPPGAGALFGLTIGRNRTTVYFVDDASNMLNLLS